MLIRIEEITFALNEDESTLKQKAANILQVKIEDFLFFEIVKKAIDSRKKSDILIVYSVNIDLGNNEKVLNNKSAKFQNFVKKHKIRLIEPFIYDIKKIDSSKLHKRPIIVGSGPAGLLAGLHLALAGANPIIIERGSKVEERVVQVHKFFTKGELNEESNVQFGEGGAGTFSDGKLYTLVNDPRSKFIFQAFVDAGAPEEIIYSARPHIGTDRLRGVVRNLRKRIISLGGEIRFDTKLTHINIENNKIKSIIINENEEIETDDLIIAIGHSARDTYELLYNIGLEIKQKPFAVGVRIEHPREMINKAQFGESCTHIKLPTANYKLVSHNEGVRSVYTFCMCPGGHVVNASSQKGKLTVNGMSEYKQNSINSNRALLVSVLPSDFPSEHPLAGVDFQIELEKKAFEVGGGKYFAPAQKVGDFLNGIPSKELGTIDTTFKPGLTMTDLTLVLPSFVTDALKKALIEFDKKIPGFAGKDAILIRVESRTSRVIRMMRNDKCESNIVGIYPAGEGAGYAGGITSSSIDGLIVAENIVNKYL